MSPPNTPMPQPGEATLPTSEPGDATPPTQSGHVASLTPYSGDITPPATCPGPSTTPVSSPPSGNAPSPEPRLGDTTSHAQPPSPGAGATETTTPTHHSNYPSPQPPSSSSSSPSPPPPPPVQPIPLELPQQPKVPGRWTWRCCRRIYNLAVTNRCLECAHRMCNTRVFRNGHGGADITLSPRVRGSTQPRKPWAVQQSPIPRPIQRKDPWKKLQKHTLCSTTLDARAWARWQEWRRGVLAAQLIRSGAERFAASNGNAEDAATTTTPKSETSGNPDELSPTHLVREYLTTAGSPGTPAWDRPAEVRRRKKLRQRLVETLNRQRQVRMRTGHHDCSVDCNWPGECHHVWDGGDNAGDTTSDVSGGSWSDSQEEDSSSTAPQDNSDETKTGGDVDLDDDETIVPDNTAQFTRDQNAWESSDAYPYPVQYINGQAYPAYETAHAHAYGYTPQQYDYFTFDPQSNLDGEAENEAEPETQPEPESQPAPETRQQRHHLATEYRPEGIPLDPALWESAGGMTSDQVHETAQQTLTSPTSLDQGQDKDGVAEQGSESTGGEDEDGREEERSLLEMHAALMAREFD